MAWHRFEEGAGGIPLFQDQMAAARPTEVVGELQPGGACSQDEVVDFDCLAHIQNFRHTLLSISEDAS